MKTIHRAILKELFISFLVGLAALNFVLMSEKVLSLTRILASIGASLSDMALIILYIQPQITVFTIPMAFLLATLLTYGRLNADSELIVLRAAGMSFREMVKPVFVLGTGCFVAGLVLSILIAPAGARKLKIVVADLISRRAPLAIEEGIFNTAFKDIVVFVTEKPQSNIFRGIFIYDERKKDRPATIYAEKASVAEIDDTTISLELNNGSLILVRDDTMTEISFGLYHLSVPVAVSPPSKRYQELSSAALLREAKTGNPKDRQKMILEFHRRITLPLVCLIVMLLGPPLALKAGKTGRLGGLSIGLLVFAGFYAALMYGESLVRAGKVPHYVGAWVPVLLLGWLAIYIFRKAESK